MRPSPLRPNPLCLLLQHQHLQLNVTGQMQFLVQAEPAACMVVAGTVAADMAMGGMATAGTEDLPPGTAGLPPVDLLLLPAAA